MGKTPPETMSLMRKQINNQIDVIEKAIAKARRNELVDLKTMEADVNILCFRIERLDDEEIKMFEPFLHLMTTKLDELENELMAFQERMGIDLSQENANNNKKNDGEQAN